MARIAIGGSQHETNTFASVKADLDAFRYTAAFPRMPRGPCLIQEMEAPGPNVADHREIPCRKLRPGLAISP